MALITLGGVPFSAGPVFAEERRNALDAMVRYRTTKRAGTSLCTHETFTKGGSICSRSTENGPAFPQSSRVHRRSVSPLALPCAALPLPCHLPFCCWCVLGSGRCQLLHHLELKLNMPP